MRSTFDINEWVNKVQRTLDKIKFDENPSVPKNMMDLGPDFDNYVKKALYESSSEE